MGRGSRRELNFSPLGTSLRRIKRKFVHLVHGGIANRRNRKCSSEMRSLPRFPCRWVCGNACDGNFLQIVYGWELKKKREGSGAGRGQWEREMCLCVCVGGGMCPDAEASRGGVTAGAMEGVRNVPQANWLKTFCKRLEKVVEGVRCTHTK